jgi:uncharacterized membrane protein YgdD (TMEM256/DUF423 family)
MERRFFGLGAFFGFLAVALGAFGAHGLRGRLSPADLAVYETGVRYQMYHALALFAAAWAEGRRPGGAARAAGWLFSVGIVLFSGSLYALVLTGSTVWGFVTPLGGLAFLAGWAMLAWTALGRRK